MDLDDLEPKKAKRYELGQDLSKLSVGELKAVIEALKDEIALQANSPRKARQRPPSNAEKQLRKQFL
jgi:uncharacterized small protein (DUF1192 family)